MEEAMTSSRTAFLVTACALVLLAAPALAGGTVIYSGVDLWQTPANGSTVVQFASNPIPAGFFCSGSAPFTGRVELKGVPLVTSPAGAFGNADTIMQRLDDAVFDADGVAQTRIQFKALSLASVRPIKTACGPFHVAVSLTGGEQPISSDMTIVREAEGGGYFATSFDADFKITFTRAKELGRLDFKARGLERFEFLWSATMTGTHTWAYKPGTGEKQRPGYVTVDTDGDFSPDTYLPGPSNFAVGWTAGGTKAEEANYIYAISSHTGIQHGITCIEC
jgi:hypothetical protein